MFKGKSAILYPRSKHNQNEKILSFASIFKPLSWNMRICGVPHDHGVLYFKILIINIQDNEKCKLLISQKKIRHLYYNS